ncbi:hypothetical protein LWI28_018444 [Acer negundo]|uniref:RNase H type-1 domain-containing protein n=1 Tax=Acer negundo TaxID=4023 RepID=A0AAD5P2E3_ACENE|nr:hypothetical protein LWI28_018444 [Acer negundo]
MVIPCPVCWQPPSSGLYKLNTDASLDSTSQQIDLGMVIRDQEGFIMGSSAQRVDANFSPKVAEALAILRGLIFAVDIGLLPVSVELDTLEVVSLINSGKDISAGIGLFVEEIRGLLLRNTGCSLGFASGKANSVAHSISKLALSVVKDCFCLESYPPCMEQFVQDDCPG